MCYALLLAIYFMYVATYIAFYTILFLLEQVTYNQVQPLQINYLAI